MNQALTSASNLKRRLDSIKFEESVRFRPSPPVLFVGICEEKGLKRPRFSVESSVAGTTLLLSETTSERTPPLLVDGFGSSWFMFIAMKNDMKQRYRVFRRGWGTFYYEDLVTKKQETLKTRDKDETYRLVAAKNETDEAPAFSLHLARVHWKAGDPAGATRTWQNVMDEIPKFKEGETKLRWLTAIKDKSLDSIRNLVVLETQADHFLKVLEEGSVSRNIYLRRIHNFALDMSWLPWPVLPKKRWPAIKFKEKRAIKWDEHQSIVARELNPERKAFYQLAWHLGASQSDIAFLDAQNIDWEHNVLSFARKSG